MKKFTYLLLFWVLCGVFDYGALYADERWHSVNEWPRLHETERESSSTTAIFALAGPLSAPAAVFTTGYCEHGWYLWGTK